MLLKDIAHCARHRSCRCSLTRRWLLLLLLMLLFVLPCQAGGRGEKGLEVQLTDSFPLVDLNSLSLLLARNQGHDAKGDCAEVAVQEVGGGG